jgi:hypothetical protein
MVTVAGKPLSQPWHAIEMALYLKKRIAEWDQESRTPNKSRKPRRQA